MKRTNCIVAMAVFFLLLAGISANTAWAIGCSDREVSCCIDGKQSETVAKTKFTRCWSWKDFGCVPCHGGGKWSYAAEWCNDNYGQCQGKCKACFHDPGDRCVLKLTCWDKDGRQTCE